GRDQDGRGYRRHESNVVTAESNAMQVSQWRRLMRRVGFVGAGNIGNPMAHCIKRKGFDLIVCDQNPAALQSFRELGARTTMEPKELAGEDAVVFMVSN